MRQGHVNLSKVEIFVLDEADRMLDMGFIPDVRKISKSLSIGRQTIMFSATMPVSVKRLADTLLKDPEYIETTPSSTTVEKIDQCMLFLSKDKKRFMLGELLADDALKKVLIFTRTKHCADRVVKNLHQVNIRADAIHGNKAQSVRQRALKSFRSGNIRALVATDIAARGIDVEGVTHVINFELPNDPENYVHRIGRTARAGATGIAISFCDHSERGYLREIEKIIRQKIPINADHPYHLAEIVSVPSSAQKKSRPHRKGVGKRNSKFKNKLKQNIEGAPRGRKAA
jgi:ATP-dependent RNA helicase RhlE